MREPVVAANWKMHKTVGEAVAFVDAFLPAIQEIPSCTVVLCPPFTALWAVGQRLRGTQVALGAQNLFWREQGAFTGEISPIMLRGFKSSPPRGFSFSASFALSVGISLSRKSFT